MPVTLENLSDRPVLFLLASGDTVRLSPGETSDELPDVEVTANSKVEKLRSRGVIGVQENPKRPTAVKSSAKAGRAKAAGAKATTPKAAGAKAAQKRGADDTTKPDEQ